MSSSESCLMFPMASNNTGVVCVPVCGLCRSQVRFAHNLLFKNFESSVNYYDPSGSPFSVENSLQTVRNSRVTARTCTSHVGGYRLL